MNRTLVMIKPDCIERRMAGNVIGAIESQALDIIQMEQIHLTHEQANKLYKEHIGQYYFDRNIKHVTSGPVIIMEVEGSQALTKCRELVTTFRDAHRDTGIVRNPRNLLHSTSDPSKVDEELTAVGLSKQPLTMAA